MSISNNWKEQLSSKIKAEMKLQGYTQAYVGELNGVSRSHMNRFLNSTQDVGVERLVNIAASIGLETKIVISKPRRNLK